MKIQLKPRVVSEQEWTRTILGISILFGIIVRVSPLLLAGFPINDGGMFAAMINDLKRNGFVLPMYTTYNLVNIPYAYPPLGFYIGALLEIAGMPYAQVLMWLPALFTTLTLPVYYLFAKELVGDRPRAALATAFFAITPGSYAFLLMGGGLTRTLGSLFFMSSLIFVRRVLIHPNWNAICFAIISCSLVVFSHPQAILLTALSCIALWSFHGRSRSTTFHVFVIAIGTLLITMPWWGTVIYRHGVDTLISAGQSGDIRASLGAIWESMISIQTIFPFAAIFRWMGIGWLIYNRRIELLILGFLPYLIDQRSAPIMTSYLYPILSAYGFMDVLPALVNFIFTRKWLVEKDEILFNRRSFSMNLLGILLYLFIECFAHAYVIRNLTISYAAREMMTWVKENSPDNSSYLILTGQADVMTDSAQEWFPVLAERHSETTLQGLEWVLGNGFYQRWGQLSFLQNCGDIDCIETITNNIKLEFTHVIIDRNNPSSELLTSFLINGYKIIYENRQYTVLKK